MRAKNLETNQGHSKKRAPGGNVGIMSEEVDEDQWLYGNDGTLQYIKTIY